MCAFTGATAQTFRRGPISVASSRFQVDDLTSAVTDRIADSATIFAKGRWRGDAS
jgi:hypothetical protein